jgi:pimeloyl-ACP methyl ester carboxylesterase
MLPQNWAALGWTIPAASLALVLLAIGGSFIIPPPHPNRLFTSATHPAHSGCRPVLIPDGEHLMPGFLLGPRNSLNKPSGLAVCVIPGAGDTKLSFKWQLVQALLAEGLTVLTIDTPGHGDYRHRPMAYPDCLSAVPAAAAFLRQQPGIKRVGLVGISLGGALAIRTAISPGIVEALVIVSTPTHLNYTRRLFYQEAWNTFYKAPSLSLAKEMSARQARQSWLTGGYRGPHRADKLFKLLDSLSYIRQIKDIPILLVYSRRDQVAPPEMAQAMLQAAPQATFIDAKRASHVMLTLTPAINQRIAYWLRTELSHHNPTQ